MGDNMVGAGQGCVCVCVERGGKRHKERWITKRRGGKRQGRV